MYVIAPCSFLVTGNYNKQYVQVNKQQLTATISYKNTRHHDRQLYILYNTSHKST